MADSFVLFVDMLGFAGMVEAAPNAGEIIEPSFGPYQPMAILTVGSATINAVPPDTARLDRNWSDTALPIAITNQATAPRAWIAVSAWRNRGIGPTGILEGS